MGLDVSDATSLERRRSAAVRRPGRWIARAALLAGLPLWTAALAGCGDQDTETTPHETTSPAYEDLPELQPNADGVYELHYGPAAVEIDGRRFCMRTYNGGVNGPTIRIPKGTDRRVHVDLHNQFTKSDYREIASMMGVGEKSCHDFNMTNLHGHGLHVQPNYATDDPADPCTGDGCEGDKYLGDNVLVDVMPGMHARYRWDLDEDGTHHEGTDWYHPHMHGSTAIQVMDGAAGALIIEGPLDEVAGIAKAKERVMVLTQPPIDHEHTVPLKEGEACTEDNLSVTDFLAVETLRKTLVNGKLQPRITTPPNQVERWRIVYAGSPDETGMKLHAGKDAQCSDFDKTPIATTQIARDGMTLPQFYKSDTIWLSPGYRADVMVKMPADKQTLCLVSRRVTDQLGTVVMIVDVDPSAGEPTETNMPDEAEVGKLARPTSWMGKTAAGQTMEVSCDTLQDVDQKLVLLVPTPGETPPNVNGDMTLSSCEPPAEPPKPDPNAAACICPAPNISCRRFDHRRAWGYRSDRVATVDTSERWRIEAFDGHPFHIHINPYLVCPNNSNKEPNFAHWRDTMWVQIDDGPRDVLMDFRKFTGQFVMHCHKLNHEDEGMMELVEICAPDDEECHCQGKDANGDCISQAGCKDEDKQCQFAKTATDAYPAPPPPNPALCGP